MTTDPQQPGNSDPVTSAQQSSADTPVAVPAPPVAEIIPESPVSEPQSEADESSAAAVRERMLASSVQANEEAKSGTAQPAPTSRGGRVEIPRADDLELDASIEAEIQSAMGGVVAPVAVPIAQTAPDAAPEETTVGPGTKVKGVVQQVHGDDVFIEAGLRHNVVVSLKQFAEDKQPAVGATLEVIIDEIDADGLIRARLPRGRHRAGGNWESLAVGQVVDCMVSAVNKGGLQVTVSGLRGFLPASQVELGFAGNLEGYLNQKLTVQITEVNPKKRNLVVSRRALLQAEREEGEGTFWSQAEVGQEYSGTVKTIKDYGAFVNIGPVDGFLHIGEISWSRINHPNEALKEGQTVDVKILKLDTEKKRISLGMKQLAQNPWATAPERYATGRTVNGKVTRITEFGAFVELEPGLEGMVHISELAWRRVGSVGEILTVGESRDFQVQDIDTKRKRVSLSLKALEKKPETAKPEKPPEEPETEASQEARKARNQNLRGGTDRGASRGGLFGNPSDFS
ncbi:MAG: S1 RNA-binding domain-containing protein [Planctomyces sp.]|nr:S1 RNA-binding domain-containing protein [Planctomyces sp.]